MSIELNRAERARMHVAMLDSLGLPPEDDQDEEERQRAAFSESILWAEDLPSVLILAEAVRSLVDGQADASYDASLLAEVHGSSDVNLAMRLAGLLPTYAGYAAYWSLTGELFKNDLRVLDDDLAYEFFTSQ